MKALFKGVLITIVILISVLGFLMFETHSLASSSQQTTLEDPHYIGTIYIYNLSALSSFVSAYGYNVSNLTNIFGEGVIHVLEYNNTRGVLGYIQVEGPEASLIFYYINSTLTQHGFKQGSYKNLIYYYANKTAIGFDGHYVYFAHDNISASEAVNMIISLYNSPKVLPSPISGLIFQGYVKNTSFEGFANDQMIILKANSTSANFTKLENLFHFFLFETHKYSFEGNVIIKNSTAVVYELTAQKDNGQSIYVIIGIEKGTNGVDYGAMIISPKQINYTEIFNYL
ncbi:MAG: hypothetical protein RRB18_07425 [Sulfolobaceae archaeon]|nr:hypothetical protein [Sulfolobaceae archaeon]